MSTHRHETAQASIDEAYIGEFDLGEHRRIRKEVEDCEVCQRYYDELSELDRAITGRPVPISPLSVDRVWGAIEAEITAKPRRTPRWLRWAFPTAALAAFALVVMVVPGSEFQSRGAGDGPEAFALSAFIVDPNTQAVERGHGAVVRVPVGRVVQLAVTARRAASIGIVGVDAQGDVHWFHGDAGSAPYLAGGDEIEEPVGVPLHIRLEDSPMSIWVVEMTEELEANGAVPPLLDFAHPALVLEAFR